MGRPVQVLKNNGDVVCRFKSIKECALAFGLNRGIVATWLSRGKERNGLRLEYDDEARITTEEQRTMWRERYAKKVLEKSLPKEDENPLPDDLTPHQMKVVVAEAKTRGIVLERLKYEQKFNVVCITPCRKKDQNVNARLFVGSFWCVKCRYFKGRCKELKEVLCSHDNYTGSERIEKRGRKRKMDV